MSNNVFVFVILFLIFAIIVVKFSRANQEDDACKRTWLTISKITQLKYNENGVASSSGSPKLAGIYHNHLVELGINAIGGFEGAGLWVFTYINIKFQEKIPGHFIIQPRSPIITIKSLQGKIDDSDNFRSKGDPEYLVKKILSLGFLKLREYYKDNFLELSLNDNVLSIKLSGIEKNADYLILLLNHICFLADVLIKNDEYV